MKVLGAVGEGLVELRLRSSEYRHASLGFGGDVANVCVMAARLGVTARLAGRIGDDPLGRRLEEFWRSAGLDLGTLRQDSEAPTGLYVNERKGDGSHGFTYLRRGSAGSRLVPEDIAPPFFERLGILVVSGVSLAVSESSADATVRAIEEGRTAGAQIACVVNHRPALEGSTARLAELARMSDVVIASREDATGVFGVDEPSELIARGALPATEVVLTDGAQPASVTWPEGRVRQPVPRAVVRNAAGAGDALAGAYLAARLLGESRDRSLARGVAAATLSVQRDGCADSYPTAEQVLDFARRIPRAGVEPELEQGGV